jgi:hypothetical protein
MIKYKFFGSFFFKFEKKIILVPFTNVQEKRKIVSLMLNKTVQWRMAIKFITAGE